MEDIKDYLTYNPESGHFTWIKSPANKIEAGTRAGAQAGRYRKIQFKRTSYQEHRLAWYFINGEFPRYQTDHINGDKTDNRIANLRAVDQFENAKNLFKHRNGKRWGVHFIRKRWHASVRVGKKNHFIGSFNREDIAEAALFGYLKGSNLLKYFSIKPKDFKVNRGE